MGVLDLHLAPALGSTYSTDGEDWNPMPQILIKPQPPRPACEKLGEKSERRVPWPTPSSCLCGEVRLCREGQVGPGDPGPRDPKGCAARTLRSPSPLGPAGAAPHTCRRGAAPSPQRCVPHPGATPPRRALAPSGRTSPSSLILDQ